MQLGHERRRELEADRLQAQLVVRRAVREGVEQLEVSTSRIGHQGDGVRVTAVLARHDVVGAVPVAQVDRVPVALVGVEEVSEGPHEGERLARRDSSRVEERRGCGVDLEDPHTMEVGRPATPWRLGTTRHRQGGRAR